MWFYPKKPVVDSELMIRLKRPESASIKLNFSNTSKKVEKIKNKSAT